MTKGYRGVVSLAGSQPGTFRVSREFHRWIEGVLASGDVLGRVVEVRITTPRPAKFKLRVTVIRPDR
jgi:hypothetical protein